MRNLITIALLLMITACSVQPDELRSPVPVTSTIMPEISASPAASTMVVPTHAATTNPTVAPVAAATVTTRPTVTRAAVSTFSGPVCTKLSTARTAVAGELGSSQKPIVIVMEKWLDADRTAREGADLADCLRKINGLVYKVQVVRTAAAALDALGAGQAHVGLIDVISIIQGQAKNQIDTGLVVLRGENLSPYEQREFIASQASGIKTLRDLIGKTLCFAEPDSPFGTMVPRIVLAANGVDPDKSLRAIKFVGSPENVATAVYKGECDAGSTYVDVLTFPGARLAKTFPDILQKVQVFNVTDEFPNDGIQYAKQLDAKIKQDTTDALLAMAADNPGKHPPLVNLFKIEGFLKADNSFYREFADLVQKAGLDPTRLVK